MLPKNAFDPTIPMFNCEAFAKCLLELKGSQRTMAEFAEATKTSAAMLSRILNGKHKKSLSHSVMMRLYEHRADHDPDKSLFWRCCAANGIINEEKSFELIKLEHSILKKKDMCFVAKEMKRAIMLWLFSNGFSAENLEDQYIPVNPATPSTEKEGRLMQLRSFSVRLKTDRHVTPNNWVIYIVPEKLNPQKPLEALYQIFLADAWHGEEFSDTKTSFTFIDADSFRIFLSALASAKLSSSMSAILLDENYKVVMEKNLPYAVDNLC